ncbi:hypothetical protein LTR78_005476 [Recurvomyces mirabilis]|uniref:A to I editase domain-containing protein n=1 Tax=Recurvomyces mirabilis TaxID=574656 RepID=A0AAE0WN96_9PEZI|nr:hypothetical protein LTR78_005476 [Recurvomyces mirabilis]KAK5152616.1 hypothetical protein LTS14_008150 [Recurvomyces mirabilis]
MPPVSADAIADCVLTAFQALPAKYKPRSLPDGRKEWTILAGIVLSREKPTPALKCISLATGMKCLPRSKLAEAKGNVLHDWHAEILALRGFNRWLVDECAEMARLGRKGRHEWLRWRHTRSRSDGTGGERSGRHEDELQRALDGVQHTDEHEPEHESTTGREEDTMDDALEGSQPFALHPEVKIHLYISSAPCGDASMELTMSSQEDSTPWATAPPTDILSGRGNFDLLGVVRRKPSRPDAPVTWSKSCSDKLALKQCTSLLSGVVSAGESMGLMWPGDCYLSTLVLPEDEIVPEAVERCFGHGPTGRLRTLTGKRWQGGYTFTPFTVLGTDKVFAYAKPMTPPSATGVQQTANGSNISALSTPTRTEVLINGVLQGRKQNDLKGASSVSRRRMWEVVRALQETLATTAGTIAPTITPTNTTKNPEPAGQHTSDGALKETYKSVQLSSAFAHRRAVKEDVWSTALQRWNRNEGDDEWRL